MALINEIHSKIFHISMTEHLITQENKMFGKIFPAL
jgi:hypothetical protein